MHLLGFIWLPVLSLTQTVSSLEITLPSNFMANPCTRLDPNAYPEAPANLALEQVHVYVRHGERTPVGVRMNGPPANIPEHWTLCEAGRKFSAAVWDQPANENEMFAPNTVDIKRVVEVRNGSALPGVCMLGELTDMGRESTNIFGKSLRKLYIEKLGFLPDSYDEEIGPVYYRSTNVPRTIESLQQIINGLYPNSKVKHRPQLLVRNAKDENIIPNLFSCKQLEKMAFNFAQAAAEKLNPTLQPLDRRLSRYFNGAPIRVDGKPRASGILDTIRAAKAHGFRVPRDFRDEEVMNLIEYAVVTEWFGGYKNREFRRLAMGPLLDDLQEKMHRKIKEEDKDPLKLHVYSTHDTALAGLLATLDIFDHRWPEFTASVTVELFKEKPGVMQKSLALLNVGSNLKQLLPGSLGLRKTDLTSGYYVRMRYQNKNLPLPYCASDGNHLEGFPELCTFRAFQQMVKELTPENWDQECIPPTTL